jgi:hypothetical protein
MADIYLPFNQQPIATKPIGGSYTVPADRYARVTVTWNVYCLVTAGLGGVATAATGLKLENGLSEGTVTFWLAPGDEINTFLTPVSTTFGFTEGGGAGTRAFKGGSTDANASIQIISANPASSYSPMGASAFASSSVESITTSGNGSATWANVLGTGTISGHVEEYAAAA